MGSHIRGVTRLGLMEKRLVARIPRQATKGLGAVEQWFARHVFTPVAQQMRRGHSAVQLKMLEETWRRHPYYWASFVPTGAWGAISGPASRPAGSS